MGYCFIEENDKLKKFKKISFVYNTIFINKKVEKQTENNKKRFAKKIRKILDKKEIEKIVISKKLKQDFSFVDNLKKQSIKIIDGRILMKYLAKEIVEYVLKYLNKDKKNIRVAIVSNELIDTVIEYLKNFALEFKEVTVVTNHPKKIINLERELYENYGTSIIITNNIKKALLKQDILLNFDFIEDEINKYYINDNCIIINFEDKIKILNKRFSGINIYDYQVECNYPKIEKYLNYDFKDVLELEVNFNTSFSNVREILKEKDVKIKFLTTYRENII